MNKVLKVLLACAFGAFIGAIVALRLNQYFWWVGMLTGGLVGYLTFEVKEVAAAMSAAWRTLRQGETGWTYWKQVFHFFKWSLAAASFTPGLFALFMVLMVLTNDRPDTVLTVSGGLIFGLVSGI